MRMRSGPSGDVWPIVGDTRHERVRVRFYSTAILLFVERDERPASQKENILSTFFFIQSKVSESRWISKSTGRSGWTSERTRISDTGNLSSRFDDPRTLVTRTHRRQRRLQRRDDDDDDDDKSPDPRNMRSHSAGRAGASEDTVSASGRDVHRWLLVGCHVSAAFKGHGTCPSESQYYHRAAVAVAVAAVAAAVAVAVASPMHRCTSGWEIRMSA